MGGLWHCFPTITSSGVIIYRSCSYKTFSIRWGISLEQYIHYMGVSSNAVTASYHPFLDGIFHYKPSILGYPNFRKPPTSKVPRKNAHGSASPRAGHWHRRAGPVARWARRPGTIFSGSSPRNGSFTKGGDAKPWLNHAQQSNYAIWELYFRPKENISWPKSVGISVSPRIV